MDSTLLKGLTVLECLAKSNGPRGIADLARALELNKSNVHRTLQTLIAAGYVRALAGGMYECTFKLFELGSVVLRRVDVRQAAEPFMQSLAERTRETIHLSVLDKTEVIYLHKIESPHPVRAYSSIGGRAPAHCVASGKALLAYNEEELKALPAQLLTFTTRSISSLDKLKRELERVRAQGFAINRGEWREGVYGLASIVQDVQGNGVASIGISGPSDRLNLAALRQFSDVVMEAACGLSRALGCNSILTKSTRPSPARELVS